MKRIVSILVLITCSIVFFAWFLRKEHSPSFEQSEQPMDLPVEDQSPNKVREMHPIQPVSSSLDKQKHDIVNQDAVWELVDRAIEQEKETGILVDDSQQSGMISKEVAIARAFSTSKPGKTCDLTESPKVQLVNNTYIVTYWGHTNPFYNYKRKAMARVAINAWTAEYVGTMRSGDNILATGISRKTGGNGKEETSERYRKRLGKSLYTLHQRIWAGQPLESERETGMVSVSKIIQRAKAQVNGRGYDQTKEPWPLLVNDLYIVTFWKKTEDIPAEGGALYDSRVGIDAKSGEFIAMDVSESR